MILRERDPLNLESPFHALDSFLTPNELFYVRNHFAVPALHPSTYALRIEGAVANPFTVNYEELLQMPSRTCAATLECAGNSRIFLVPQESGNQWELGAVATAEWTGVRLCELLNRAGPLEGAVEVLLEGADQGEPTNSPKPAEPILFARSLPISKALQSEVLIAYRMNGAALSAEHGFPIRAVVPGYYGMASVKWLTRISVVREPFHGYWQATDYAYWETSRGHAVRRALNEVLVKSAIARPQMHEVVPPDKLYRVFGFAWAGESEIVKVELSTDGGRGWHSTEFLDAARRHAWRRWEYQWRTPTQAGQYTLMSRATDSAGLVQPAKHDRNYGSYAIHHTLPIEVFV